jgi:hypothetical protein
MLTKTKIALSVAIALGSAPASLTTYAFAANNYDSPDWAPPLYTLDVQRHPAVGHLEGIAPAPAAAPREELNATRQPKVTRRGY